MRTSYRRVACVFVVEILVAGLFLAWGSVRGHSGDWIDAEWASVVPVIDGNMGPGEWADAAAVDLGTISGNEVQAALLVKNNDTFLWFAYDVTGDVTDGTDSGAFALDTGHDQAITDGGEDEFALTWNGSAHFVYTAWYGYWMLEDSPFDPTLPDHAGLSGASGFGPSDLSPANHRIFEFQIPIALIGATAGDTVGLIAGGHAYMGVWDGAAGYSTWPIHYFGSPPHSSYGDLTLATPPGPVGVSISPSSASRRSTPGSSVDYSLVVRNRGTAGPDTFNIRFLSIWSASLLDASGTSPLTDTDGDGVPDTGIVASGGSLGLVVRVSLPVSATGCDYAYVNATSSVDISFSDTSVLSTCTGLASFAPPHRDFGFDTDGDFLYNHLEVDVTLSVTTSGYYAIAGDLYDGNGSVLIHSNSWYTYLYPGSSVAPITFDGRRIFGAGLDGPYLVELRLSDSYGQLVDTDQHTTGAYALDDFNPPPAWFAPPHSDLGIDEDIPANGKYDRLVLRASLFVDRPGYYYLNTEVYDSNGSFVTYGSNYSSVYSHGNTVIQVTYAGLTLFQAAGDGPYRIEMRLFDNYNFVNNGTHVTGSYLRTDFDPPPVSFAPPHLDYGEDADVPPDGLYDFLTVKVSLMIGEDGDFRIAGSLYGPVGWPPITGEEVIVSLTAGPATVDLRFSGPAIMRVGQSGNFVVDMTTQKVGDYNATDWDFYATGYYNFTDFQPPPARFSSPHRDRVVDTSDPPDGLNDYLVIDASVEVTRAGRFTVEAYVYEDYGRFATVALGAADLTVGSHSIPIRIDGHRIWEQRPPMPLSAYLELYDQFDNALDFGQHRTGSYDPRSFQPPDVDVPSSTAIVSGSYLRSGSQISIGFVAADPTPSDGIASVALYYRYSPNNLTWFPWTQYMAQAGSMGDSELTGTFPFDLPRGDGYYEFYTLAADYGGNEETSPPAPDASLAAYLAVRLELVAGSSSMDAGGAIDVLVHAMSRSDDAVTTEVPIQVRVLSASSTGRFLDAGGNPVTQVVIPAGSDRVAVRYTDTRAGTTTLGAFAYGLAPGSAPLSVNPGPAHELTLSPSSAGIAVASSVPFTATVRDAYGNTIANAPLAWSVQGNVGAIASSGVFTAGTDVRSGTVSISSGTLTASASVVLSPGPAARVEVFASDYSIAPGETATVRGFAFDEYGNAIPSASFTWSRVGPGTLSAPEGDIVTVFATGSGTIRVRASSGSLEASVDLIVKGSGEAASIAPIGVGGVILGLVAGFTIGWVLSRRRQPPRKEAQSPPQEPEPSPPS